MNLTPSSLAPSSPSPLSAPDLHDCPDVELDLLPYGVICLDREGVIVRYNRVEARFARLDRALVLNKPFFGVVAPCTATPEFEGRFRAFVNDPQGPAQVVFPYVFNFRFGAQEVDVEIRRSRSPDHFYLLVGRRRFRGSAVVATPGGNERGVALEELAPDEPRQGVVRDELLARNIVVDSTFFEALHLHLREDGGADELGVRWGRRVALDLETESAESFDRPLRRVPIVTALEMITRYVKRQGWGQLVVDLEHAPEGMIGFELERSVLAETASNATRPRCGIMSGFLQALLMHLAERPMVVREIRCRALGAPSCLFAGVGAAKANALAEAAGTANDLAALARFLQGRR